MTDTVQTYHNMLEMLQLSRTDHVFQVSSVVVDDLILTLLLLTMTYSLEHSFQTPIECSKVGLREQRGHTVQRIMG